MALIWLVWHGRRTGGEIRLLRELALTGAACVLIQGLRPAFPALTSGIPDLPLPGAALLETAKVIAAVWAGGGLLVMLLLGLYAALARLPLRDSLLIPAVTALAAAPLAVSGMLAALLAYRASLIDAAALAGFIPPPAGFVRLALAGLMTALFPAMLAVRAGIRALAEEVSATRELRKRWPLAASAAAASFSRQGGYLLGGALLAEVIFNIPGVSRVLLEAVIGRGLPGGWLFGVLPAVLLMVRLRALAAAGVDEAVRGTYGLCGSLPQTPISSPWWPGVWLVIALIALAIGLVNPLRGSLSLYVIRTPDPATEQVEPPLTAGTVASGAAGGLVAAGLGGVWGLLARRAGHSAGGAARWRDAAWTALMVPAEALILAQPALITLLLAAGTAPLSPLAGGVLSGLVLVPRMVRAAASIDAGGPVRSGRLQGLLFIALLAAAGTLIALNYYAAFRLLAVEITGLHQGVFPAGYRDLYSGVVTAPGAGYYRLALELALPVGAAAVSLFALLEAVSHYARAEPQRLLEHLLS
ncbi:MAG: hypothetical protein Kow00124_01700 [Anaerolineae bacterium]